VEPPHPTLAAAHDAHADVPDQLLCIACSSRVRNVALWPCLHLCLCRTCSRQLVDQSCPICRARVRRYLPLIIT
jgi:hypothetical protein